MGGADETASHKVPKTGNGAFVGVGGGGPISSGTAWLQVEGRNGWWRSPKEGIPEEGSLRPDLRGKALQNKVGSL